MKFLRLALSALFVLPLVSSVFAQDPTAWSSFVDLHRRAFQKPLKIVNAPNGGFYAFGLYAVQNTITSAFVFAASRLKPSESPTKSATSCTSGLS